MSEGTSLLDQVERLEMEFSRQVVFAPPHFSSSPWRRLEVANQLRNWLEEWGRFFPQNPLTPETIETEHQRALAEILRGSRMNRLFCLGGIWGRAASTPGSSSCSGGACGQADSTYRFLSKALNEL
ncbi:hypothetical protein GOODEAATRI_025853 [Goodea atripinnis]|uniref:Uncharacterized protein n=1 Tax=Goodea atripinnis TaxID=208336 RepID=A0ABV0PH33_9TELE